MVVVASVPLLSATVLSSTRACEGFMLATSSGRLACP
jgi:hypothetical protein